MSRPRAQSSHTLPRNFTFHYTDANPPRTPEPLDMGGPPQPPEPPRPQAYRLRRRRELRQLSSDYFRPRNPRDVPVPTIEVSDPAVHDEPQQQQQLHQADFQLTATTFGQLSRPRGSPPKTPSAQIFDSTIAQEAVSNQWESAEVSSQGESISRPSTACSGFSDSSISSSLESFPSLGGSLTSPESDVFDLNAAAELADHQPAMLSSPLKSYGKALAQPTHPRAKPTWTEQMDAHLWMTYMRYLQDPTHTPFKMLPGTAPPLGVCSRIVREAKRTWKGARSSGAIRAYRFMPWGQTNRADSPDTIKPTHSGSSTPTEANIIKTHSAWPRSDSATRRRLRELCKLKPTLSAHYNRLLHTRSSSPFPSSVRSRSTSVARDITTQFGAANVVSAFSTREMDISLATSTASTMQYGNALSQLASDVVTPQARPSDQFGPPSGRLNAHHKSQSLQLNLGSDYYSESSDRMLGSPFEPAPVSQGLHPHGSAYQTPMASAPHLASPLQLPPPIGRSGSFKRRNEDDGIGGLDSNSANSPFPDFDPRHGGLPKRRIRARGFSLGDVSESSRRLSNLFAPPTNVESSQAAVAFPELHTGSCLMPPAPIERMRRLGSPFTEKPSKPHFNTFPRNFSLHGLEPAIESHEERLDPSAFTETFGKQ